MPVSLPFPLLPAVELRAQKLRLAFVKRQFDMAVNFHLGALAVVRIGVAARLPASPTSAAAHARCLSAGGLLDLALGDEDDVTDSGSQRGCARPAAPKVADAFDSAPTNHRHSEDYGIVAVLLAHTAHCPL